MGVPGEVAEFRARLILGENEVRTLHHQFGIGQSEAQMNINGLRISLTMSRDELAEERNISAELRAEMLDQEEQYEAQLRAPPAGPSPGSPRLC